MTISSKLAQNIVQSIKEIIHHEINFMNMEGVIIASTDPVRIGQQHEGALKVSLCVSIVVVGVMRYN